MGALMREAASRLAANRVLSAVLAAAIPLAGGSFLFALKGVPQPRVHDEFSYLFAADTFAHGRLANPAHPFWRHFESFDLLSRPTLMSRKPPGQGLALALGEVLTGKPIAGVLLTTAAACAAIYWMLLAFVEPPWALGGAVLTAAHPLVFFWSVSYWGGGVALLGGALALGGWRRLQDGRSARAGAAFGIGLAVLANSRPFEGLVLSLALAANLMWRGPDRKTLVLLGLILSASAAAMGFYNFRVTGSALHFPYTEYELAYGGYPPFIWQRLPPPRVYRTKEFDEYWNHWERDLLLNEETPGGARRMARLKLSRLGQAWLQPLPVRLLLAGAVFGLAPWPLTALLAFFVLAVTLPLRAVTSAYNSAPGGGLFFAVLVMALRRLASWRWRARPLGIWMTAGAVMWMLGASLRGTWDYAHARDEAWSILREDIRKHLCGVDGKHLVFVRYGPGHSVHQEWVYNDAEMDSSRVIWARTLSPEEDGALAAHYRDRTAWDLDVDPPRIRLRPNPGGAGGPPPASGTRPPSAAPPRASPPSRP